MHGRRSLVLVMLAVAAAFAPAATAGAQQVAPTLDCVSLAPATNAVTATWGYVNAGSTSVTIPPGNGNSFAPFPSFQGQPVILQPGEFQGVFQTSFSLATTQTQTWTLGRTPVTASLASPLCAGTSASSSAPASPTTAPESLVAPSVTGTPVVGLPLNGDRGTWLGYPAREDLQWQRQAPGGDWEDIPDANAPTYTPAPGDGGDLLRLEVTALSVAAVAGDAGDQGVAASDPTAAVAAPPSAPWPTTRVKTFSFTALPGQWSGVTQFDYDWQRCTAATCVDTGVTTPTIVFTDADVHHYLRVVVRPSGLPGPIGISSERWVQAAPPA